MYLYSSFLARIFWSGNWTNTIYRSVSCLLVHQEKTAEKSTRQSAQAQTSLIVVLLTTAGMMNEDVEDNQRQFLYV